MTANVSGLLTRSDIWLGRQWQHDNQSISSGFTRLDQHLAGQGWPQHGVVELVGPMQTMGMADDVDAAVSLGLTDLLLPVLAAHQDSERWQLCVAPPAPPHAPAWAAAGVDLARFVWVEAECRKERLWTLEHSLNSGRCSVILAWLDSLSASEARRLQLAAQKGQCLLFLHLPESVLAEHHAVALRLGLVPESQGCTVQLIKQRGGWPQPDLALALPHRPERVPRPGMALPQKSASAAGVVQGPW
ncbi:translesion DNA synthesis-associated protein ImuA [Ferrimonas pelagia]|uniref:Translesion DNA synthesis-associated protein ImuA n=1 Tax=Ferrimonas pelagia TaxID=1177826 RepID=A0ABP9EDW9_9GAMM